MNQNVGEMINPSGFILDIVKVKTHVQTACESHYLNMTSSSFVDRYLCNNYRNHTCVSRALTYARFKESCLNLRLPGPMFTISSEGPSRC